MKTRVMAAALWGICSFAQAGVVDFYPAYVVCNDDKGKQVACVDYLNPAPSYGTIAGLRNWTETDGRGIEPEDTVNDKGSANAETSSASPVPEPATFLMMVVGLIFMGGIGRHVKEEPFK